MKRFKPGRRSSIVLVFGLVFGASLAIGAAYGLAVPASAAPALQATQTPGSRSGGNAGAGTYVGPSVCAACHADIVKAWKDSRHAQAFSSPIFQQNWTKLGSQFNCLQCHTTGSDPTTGKYAVEGVTCKSCHGPFIQGHPQNPCRSSRTPRYAPPATSPRRTNGAPASTAPPASIARLATTRIRKPRWPTAVTALCTTCHKDQGSGFTHSTHANAGLQCSDCHMYTPPSDGRADRRPGRHRAYLQRRLRRLHQVPSGHRPHAVQDPAASGRGHPARHGRPAGLEAADRRAGCQDRRPASQQRQPPVHRPGPGGHRRADGRRGGGLDRQPSVEGHRGRRGRGR